MTEPACDFQLSDLFERVEGEHGAAVMIAGHFARQRRSLLEPLLAALLAGDGATAIDLAHELKGMAAMIGATQLAEVAVQIQEAARRGALAGVSDSATRDRLVFHWDAVARCLAPLAPPLSAS